MSRFFKFFEYAYLVFAILFLVKAIQVWSTEPSRAYLFLFFVVVATGMFFFKRHFRNKYKDKGR
ncbi:MAG: hypothetical protein WBG71_08555 [Leeuwenhoekiella sp.]